MFNLKSQNALQASILIICAGLIVFLPTLDFMPSNMYLHDRHRLLQLILLSCVLVYSSLPFKNNANQANLNGEVRYLLSSILGLALVSSFLSLSPRHAFIELSIFVALGYLALFFANLYILNKNPFVKYLMLGIWVSIVLYIFAFCVGYVTACIFKTPLRWPQPLLGFNNTRSFNQYQLWGLCLAYLPLLGELKENKVKTFFLNAALILWWAVLYFTASRGVLLAWFAGLIIVALLYKKTAFSIVKLQLIHAILGFLTFYFLFEIVPDLLHFETITVEIIRNRISDRTTLWNLAASLTLSHPILGVGPMNFPWYGPTHFHPHNSILQLSSEWGLPATFIILGLAGWGIYNWLKRFGINQTSNQTDSESKFSMLLLLTIVINAAYSMVDGVIVMPMSQVMMFIVIGMMIGQYQIHNKQNQIIAGTKQKFGFRHFFAACTLVCLAWSTLPEIKQGIKGYPPGFSLGENIINPRIWIQMASPPKNPSQSN